MAEDVKPEKKPARPKTGPRVVVVPQSAVSGTQAEAKINQDGGVTLKLSPALTEWLGRWVFRLVTMGGIGFLAVDKIATKDETAIHQAQVDKRLDRIEELLSKLLVREGVKP